ncbi:DUF6817 domain-containing protein [Nocardia sp. NBC_01327]|uniref:DUF6817 domain-containing protein n=1 Tax=Nocardia sp. NBC_01327 TaxID=2903593 RepID=UPI002E164925|nr:hypothetical protein OG326_28785 [Nocardia sp. NBC_01327]
MKAFGRNGFRRGHAEQFLVGHGADRIPHPGGTLLAHLIRVADVLAGWDADENIQLAGLCHAAYGTDGFAQSLLELPERATLAALIGNQAEALVYFYGSCDRGFVYPRLATSPVLFRDRFTGADSRPPTPAMSAFLEITAANELDVMAHNEALAAQHGAALHALFAGARQYLSPKAWEACDAQLRPE